MKIALINRERLLSLGQFLVDELDSLVARIRASWEVQHTADGAHAHVTADTISVGRLTYSDIAEVTISTSETNNLDPEGLSTAGLLRLQSSLGLATITGIHVPQDESGAVLDGRVLVLENISTDTVFTLSAEDTNSSPRNRIITPWGPPLYGDASPMLVYLRPAMVMVLIYNADRARWITQVYRKDENQTFNTLAPAVLNNVNTAGLRRAGIWRLQFTGTGATISGFDATNVPETTLFRVTNTGLYKFEFLHMNTGSNAGNRIQCPGGVRYMLHPRESVDVVKTATGWRLLEKADQWIDVTFAAGNFTANGAGTWTVQSADQGTLAYQIDGNKMTVSFFLNSTSVAGGPTSLQIAIPGGRTAARTMVAALAQCVDNGVEKTSAHVAVAAGFAFLFLRVDATAATAWANSTNATNVSGQITFMVYDDCAAVDEDHSDIAHADTVHADADHSDVTHVDTSHADSHSDSAHADGFHSDTPHVDTPHSDVSHSDSHTDVAHVDVAHDDVAHEDVAHSDFHEDFPQGGHGDEHDDDPHQDVTHGDAEHEDTAHDDVAHSDVAHSDVAHDDVTHADDAHGDSAHADTHSDTPHSDTAHVDQGHGDTPHADTAHDDLGYHCDVTHSDI